MRFKQLANEQIVVIALAVAILYLLFVINFVPRRSKIFTDFVLWVFIVLSISGIAYTLLKNFRLPYIPNFSFFSRRKKQAEQRSRSAFDYRIATPDRPKFKEIIRDASKDVFNTRKQMLGKAYEDPPRYRFPYSMRKDEYVSPITSRSFVETANKNHDMRSHHLRDSLNMTTINKLRASPSAFDSPMKISALLQTPPSFFHQERANTPENLSTLYNREIRRYKENEPTSHARSRSLLSSNYSQHMQSTKLVNALPTYGNEDEDMKNANETLQKHKIALVEMQAWIERCRHWFFSKLVPELLNGHFSNYENFNKVLAHTGFYVMMQEEGRGFNFEEDFPRRETEILKQYGSQGKRGVTLEDVGTFLYGHVHRVKTSSLLTLDSYYINKELIAKLQKLMAERKRLNEFLNVGRSENNEAKRKYVIKRLSHMIENPLIYRNDCGGQYRGKNWDETLPTDSKILASMFFQFLESEDKIATGSPRSILIEYPLSPPRVDFGDEGIFFHQKAPAKFEPHYNLVSGTEHFHSFPGKNNIFNAVSIFLWLLKTKLRGEFRGVNYNHIIDEIITYS